MKNSLYEDLVGVFWLLLIIGASIEFLLLLVGWLPGPSWLRLSLGVAITFISARLVVVLLWALLERFVLNPKGYRDKAWWRFFYLFKVRFYTFGKDLMILPTVRRIYFWLAGIKTIDPQVVFDGSVRVDLYSFLSIGKNAVLSGEVWLANIEHQKDYQAPTEIGAGAIIEPGVIIGPGVKIGQDALIEAGTVLEPNSRVADGVIVPAKSRIERGTDGAG
jgi:hypothetical protein